jgi:hypothetical protein
MANAMLMTIRALRETAPRLDADGIAKALGAIWVNMGGGDAPTGMPEHFNPSTAAPPMVDAERVPNSIAATPQQTANWNVLLDAGFVEKLLANDPVALPPTPPGAATADPGSAQPGAVAPPPPPKASAPASSAPPPAATAPAAGGGSAPPQPAPAAPTPAPTGAAVAAAGAPAVAPVGPGPTTPQQVPAVAQPGAPVGEQESFTARGEAHRVWIEITGATARIMVASDPAPLLDRFGEIAGRCTAADDETKGIIAKGTGIADKAKEAADRVAKVQEARRTSPATPVDGSTVLADEAAVVAAEKQLSPLVQQLFERMGVGKDEEIVDVTSPLSKAKVRCIRRDKKYIPIGKITVYLMGLAPRAPIEELRDINMKLQAGLKGPERVKLEKRRDEIRDGALHNQERSRQMWEKVQAAGLDDSIETLNKIAAALLDADPKAEQVEVEGADGKTLVLEPGWQEKELAPGEKVKYLDTIMVKGVKKPAP